MIIPVTMWSRGIQPPDQNRLFVLLRWFAAIVHRHDLVGRIVGHCDVGHVGRVVRHCSVCHVSSILGNSLNGLDLQNGLVGCIVGHCDVVMLLGIVVLSC